MPPEWAEHERTVMAWPARDDMWGDHLAAAKATHAAVANAVLAFEPVLLVADGGDGPEAAAACPGADVVEWPLDDSWARDIGAIVLTDGDRRVGLDPVFNAWGEKFHPYDEDARFAERMADHLGLERLSAFPFVLEGGAITVDGDGTVVTTEQCLLNPNRNPALDRAGVEAELRRWLGVERVVWLPHGLVEDDDTDGHVDNVALCIRPGVVLAQTVADPADVNHDRLRRNADVLVDAGYEVIEIDVLPTTTFGGEPSRVPPLNLYLTNGGAVVPVVDGPGAEAALDQVRAALPEREVVGVNGEVLAFGGGGIHCITQQVPR
jgi:agmatine deiminase